MKLYDYFRSSASYRVRIALNWKGVAYEKLPVNLLQGQQRSAPYRAVNPQQLVPTLDTGSDLLNQSLAICEYLEETFPEPPLLPAEALARARVRSLAQCVACDIHPIANLRVLNRLRHDLGVPEAHVVEWIRHWIGVGFEAIEAQLDPRSAFACGSAVTLADVCLVPQHFNAVRFETPLDAYPRIRAVVVRCNELPAFANALREAQG
ncbi:MAG: maleylacetoacetate isomerase [Gammaproteobacteria bacterium]|nr:maleylacetoacetate isomerase [Gammaproteobacteria bacterium]